MRHRVKLNHLGRKSAHRKALLSHLANDLIKNKRIITTLAKAKALRVYVEPLITKAKENTTHQRRVVFSYLQDKETVTELFGDISAKVGTRPGGYTRIIKLGARLGDAAEMALIELVDYNELYSNEPAAGKKKRTRRSSRSKKASTESKEKTDVKDSATAVAGEAETETKLEDRKTAENTVEEKAAAVEAEVSKEEEPSKEEPEGAKKEEPEGAKKEEPVEEEKAPKKEAKKPADDKEDKKAEK